MQKRIFAICALALFICVALTGCEITPSAPEEEEWITVTVSGLAMGIYYPLKPNLNPNTDIANPFDVSKPGADINSGVVIFEFSVAGGTPQTAISSLKQGGTTDFVAVELKVWKDQGVVVTAHLQYNPIENYPWWGQYAAGSITIPWTTMFVAAEEQFEKEARVSFDCLIVYAPVPGSMLP